MGFAERLLSLRCVYASSGAVAAGHWPRNALSNDREIGGKTLGLVGFGSIGQLTERLGKSLGMDVAAFDAMLDRDHPAYAEAGVRCAGLDEVIAMSDVVNLHVPLVDSTRGLLNAARIAAMKPGAVLINTARAASSTRRRWPPRCAPVRWAVQPSTCSAPNRCRPARTSTAAPTSCSRRTSPACRPNRTSGSAP